MIVERRAYTLRPDRLETFWDLQEARNTEAVFGPIRRRCIGYFSAVTGPRDQVVHLYRFDSLDQWQAIYGAYYQAQSPDYFATVRPLMLAQENGFLAPPPVPALAELWTGDTLALPPALRGVPADSACVVETTLDLFPGGAPVYWQAHGANGIDATAADRPHLMAMLVSLIGRLHRLVRYDGYASVSAAQDAMATRAGDPRHQAFVRAYGEWVAAETVLLLRPSRLASRRPLFEAAAPP